MMEALIAGHGWRFFWMAVLLASSGFFSGSESALFRLSPHQVSVMSLGGSLTSRWAAWLLRRPRELLITILLGNLLVNVFFFALAAGWVMAMSQSGPYWVTAIAGIAPLMILILIGEILPKVVAVRSPERVSRFIAAPLSACHLLLFPVRWILLHLIVMPLTRLIGPKHREEGLSLSELRELLDLSAEKGIIDAAQRGLLEEVMELSDLTVRDIMAPRVDVASFPIDGDPAAFVELVRRTRYEHIPLLEKELDHIVGVVESRRALLSPDRLKDLARAPLFVPEVARIEDLLEQFREADEDLAVVVDEYGGTAGLVTRADVAKQFGYEMEQYQQRPHPTVQRIDEGEYFLDGSVPIHELVGPAVPEAIRERVTTVGGFVTAPPQHIPKVGEEVQFGDLHFRVDQVRGRRIGQVRLKLAGKEENHP